MWQSSIVLGKLNGHLGTSRMEVLSELVPFPSYPWADHIASHTPWYASFSSVVHIFTVFLTMTINCIHDHSWEFLHYFCEREARENNHGDGTSCPLQLSFCAGPLHWSECCLIRGWDFHRRYPSRLCNFPDQIAQLMEAFSRQSCSRCLLCVHWLHRCWPTPLGSPNPL